MEGEGAASALEYADGTKGDVGKGAAARKVGGGRGQWYEQAGCGRGDTNEEIIKRKNQSFISHSKAKRLSKETGGHIEESERARGKDVPR